MILLPAFLFATAPGFRSGPEGEPPTDAINFQIIRAVTASAVGVAKPAFPETAGLAVIPAAPPAVPVPMLVAVPPPPVPRESESGEATWYGAPEGTCAHVTLPFGTVVTVTRLSTGSSTTCRVADRGPFGEGRVVDMSEDTFSALGDLSEGVFQVQLEW